MCVAFRRHTLLALDDRLYALQASIPHLNQSALHRLFQRHDINRLPDMEGDKPKRSKFKRYSTGYLPIDIAELRTEEGKLWMFVAIDRTSKFAFAWLVPKAGKMAAAAFLREVIEALPYPVHTVLTGEPLSAIGPRTMASGIRFTNRKKDQDAFRGAFGIARVEHGLEHRLTKVNHPWTKGQVERMNRTIKDATVNRYHSGSHDQLRTHLADCVAADNFARHLKTLRGFTPYEHIVKCWTEEPDRFKIDPRHQIPGPNT